MSGPNRYYSIPKALGAAATPVQYMLQQFNNLHQANAAMQLQHEQLLNAMARQVTSQWQQQASSQVYRRQQASFADLVRRAKCEVHSDIDLKVWDSLASAEKVRMARNVVHRNISRITDDLVDKYTTSLVGQLNRHRSRYRWADALKFSVYGFDNMESAMMAAAMPVDRYQMHPSATGGTTAATNTTFTVTTSTSSTTTSNVYWIGGGGGVSNAGWIDNYATPEVVYRPRDQVYDGEAVKISLPDGTVIDVAADGSFKILDAGAKVTYRANRIRAFNRYLNVSDRLEEFIGFCGEQKLTQQEFLGLPIKLFMQWLVVEAAKADREPEAPEAARLLPELRQAVTPRCPGCGRFLPKFAVEKRLPFCAPVCYESHYNRMLPGGEPVVNHTVVSFPQPQPAAQEVSHDHDAEGTLQAA